MLFRVVITGVLNGAINQNVLHFKKAGAVWPTDGAALCADIRDNWLGGTNGVRQGLITLQKWTLIQAYNRDTIGDVPVSLSINVTGAKVGNGTQSFGFSAILIRLRAASGGKRGRGRCYLPGIDPSTWNAGVMSQTEIDAWTPRLAQLTTRYVGASPSSGFQLVVAPKSGVNPTTQAVVRLELATVPGVQRRRNIGVGV